MVFNNTMNNYDDEYNNKCTKCKRKHINWIL